MFESLLVCDTLTLDRLLATHLAVDENMATSTQNQAFHTVLFLYKEVLKQDLDLKVDAVRAKKYAYQLGKFSIKAKVT
ncbi:hypothetical protein B4U84_16570 [Westiellopsis prolifica IICB1]|nr:hypothetical protein B4U84_16570 [Westiellopsis prolifica IICB1]